MSQFRDLVAEARGPLELQGIRRLPHLLLQPLDEALQVAIGGVSQHTGKDVVSGHVKVFLGPDGVLNRLGDRLRGDAMLLVILRLDLPAAVRLADGLLHGGGHPVGVHENLPPHVPGRPSDDLDERHRRSQEPLGIGVEDGDHDTSGRSMPSRRG